MLSSRIVSSVAVLYKASKGIHIDFFDTGESIASFFHFAMDKCLQGLRLLGDNGGMNEEFDSGIAYEKSEWFRSCDATADQ